MSLVEFMHRNLMLNTDSVGGGSIVLVGREESHTWGATRKMLLFIITAGATDVGRASPTNGLKHAKHPLLLFFSEPF